MRTRGDGSGAMLALADGRYAVTGETVVAIGGRRALADWCERRAERAGVDAVERAWWQEVTGALIARGHEMRRALGGSDGAGGAAIAV